MIKYEQFKFPAVLLTALAAAPAFAQEGINFTSEQAESGQAIYVEHCQMCHGSNLDNGQFATPIKGFFFTSKWGGMTLGDLVRFTTTEMPPGNPGVLRTGEHLDVLAFILRENGFEAGEEELVLDYEKLDQVVIPE